MKASRNGLAWSRPELSFVPRANNQISHLLCMDALVGWPGQTLETECEWPGIDNAKWGEGTGAPDLSLWCPKNLPTKNTESGVKPSVQRVGLGAFKILVSSGYGAIIALERSAERKMENSDKESTHSINLKLSYLNFLLRQYHCLSKRARDLPRNWKEPGGIKSIPWWTVILCYCV